MSIHQSLLFGGLASHYAPANAQIAQPCNGVLSSEAAVACVSQYAAVMPQPFTRGRTEVGGEPNQKDMFKTTEVADDSFKLVSDADFVVFNEELGTQILGATPSLELMFTTRNDSIHEAPVYVPELDSIIFSQPHQGIYKQQMINLKDSPPTIADYTTHPPVYAVNGGKYYQGNVYWASEAGTTFPNPSGGGSVTQAPGIYKLNPTDGTVETLLNNYFGTQFNSPNDLIIDKQGYIWFTDSWYGYAINVTASPVLPTATWRFNPTTGQVTVMDVSLEQPNGIGISPDGETMYISDTGITDFSHPPPPGILPKYTINMQGGRYVYAFDIKQNPSGPYLVNKRPIWLAEQFADDGLHVSQEGYLIGAAGASVDILSPYGDLLVKIQTSFVVNNVQFAGPDRSDLWLFGMGGISRVKWNLKGMLNG